MLLVLATALVVCAPGYPGSAAEAQPAMDALARELGAAARLPHLTASYEETAEGGLHKLAAPDSAVLLATLPFFLEHEHDLHLTARLMAVPQDGQPLQRWTLVTGKDHPPRLSGYSVESLAGSSKQFVHAAAPGLPPDAPISAPGTVLSGLRRAANGEKIALLLDGTQASSLKTLPFAAQLATVESSAPMPVAIVATVGTRLGASKWKALEAAFLAMGKNPAAHAALAGVEMTGFGRLDEAALSSARAAFSNAAQAASAKAAEAASSKPK
jgi:hypothetical protein